jgi:hypothetical protein
MKPLNEIFDVAYGHKLDLNKLTESTSELGGINFVGRSSQNHGVTGVVSPVPGLAPYEAGLITVALGGTKLLASFVQEAPFYTAQNVAVLRPKTEITFQQKLYICIAIRHNRFRYSAFGREANRTLRTLMVPEVSDLPEWISDFQQEGTECYKQPSVTIETPTLKTDSWIPFQLQQLFEIKKGQRLTKADMLPGNTPYIGASDSCNGVTAKVGQEAIHPGGTISVSYNGSVAEAFYQPEPYWATDDVNVLYPRHFNLTPAVAIFICTLIRREKYRFNYGRKWHLERMREFALRLPATNKGEPDFEFMDKYVCSLPYSSQIA